MSKLKTLAVFLSVSVLAVFSFIEIFMPLSIADVAKCDGMASEFTEFANDKNLSGVEHNYCIPRAGFFLKKDPDIVLYVNSKDTRIRGVLCSALRELKIAKNRVVHEEIRESVKTLINGVVQTNFEHPEIAMEIVSKSCRGREN